MMTSRTLLAVLFVAAVGCKSSDFADIDLGTVTVAPYQVHVLQEADFAAGATTKYAIVPTGGPGKPDVVECWYGVETTTPHVATVYDAGDSDYDCTVTAPTPLNPGDKLWFAITVGGKTATGSVTPKP